MSEARDEIAQVVQQWVLKAENDLTTAAHTLRLGEACPTDTVCFHAQQCVEKYLKALLVWHSIDFHWIHDLGALLELLPPQTRPELAPEDQARLTDYATITRYPGDYDAIPLSEARHAVAIARQVREQVRQWLPREALREG